MSYAEPRVTLAQAIAEAAEARNNCLKSGNDEWRLRWESRLNELADYLPSGSGVDNGTAILWDSSNTASITLHIEYHHMNDGGFYDGWTEHSVVVKPTFSGLNVHVKGRDRNQIKDYLSDLLHESLNRSVDRFSPTIQNPLPV